MKPDELSRRRVRSVHGVVKLGRQIVVEVIRVDEAKSERNFASLVAGNVGRTDGFPQTEYVDLSKRQVSPEDLAACTTKYSSGKQVQAILRYVADKTGKTIESLAETISWPLYANEKYEHALDAFKFSLTYVPLPWIQVLLLPTDTFSAHSDPSVFDELHLPPDVLTHLRFAISRNLTPPALKLRADLELSNFSYSGILGIQAALQAAESLSTPEVEIKMKLVVSPLYVMISHNSTGVEGAIRIMRKAIEVMREVLEKNGGSLVVKMEPKIVSQVDDAQLDEMMEKARAQNEEVDGDGEYF